MLYPISNRVVEKTGSETGFQLVISRAVLEADYIINVPIFKTHSSMMITGALKNVYGYVAGACKARLHFQLGNGETFARTVCDIHQVRPPDLHIMDAITAIEGNGPCHGRQLRPVGKLLASYDPLAVDGVMARMMGVDPAQLPVQKEALARGLGALVQDETEILGELLPIPGFKMPVTFFAATLSEEERAEFRRLYPFRMMEKHRDQARPKSRKMHCMRRLRAELPCAVHDNGAGIHIGDGCIACYCCVELCPEGAMEVPDVEVFRHY